MEIPHPIYTVLLGECSLFSCTAPEQTIDGHAQAKAEIKEKGFLVSSILGSQNLLIETDTFTGVLLLDQENKQEDSTISIPAVEEVLLAEKILVSCFEKDTVDYSHDSMFISKRRIYPLTGYRRQYEGSLDTNGHKILHINFSNDRENDAWLRRKLSVKDGGKSFWSISINLTTKRCGYFIVNGLAYSNPEPSCLALNKLQSATNNLFNTSSAVLSL